MVIYSSKVITYIIVEKQSKGCVFKTVKSTGYSPVSRVAQRVSRQLKKGKVISSSAQIIFTHYPVRFISTTALANVSL
jgi:hypothetical protein